MYTDTPQERTEIGLMGLTRANNMFYISTEK